MRFTSIFFGLGLSFLALSGVLLAEHGRAIRAVREVAIPLIAEVPRLEKRLQYLEQQLELAELHAATRTGSQEERLNVFVLPTESDLDRLLAVLDLLREHLRKDGQLGNMSAIEIGDPSETELPEVSKQSLSFSVSVTDRGLQDVFLFVRLAGLLTIGDVMTPAELSLFLNLTEAENPAGLVALEQFLSTDLLLYARDPRAYEEKLARSFSSQTFDQALQTVLQSSFLHDARSFLGGSFGRSLHSQDLWPLQFMSLNEARIEQGGVDGWYRVTLDLSLYSRSEK